MKKALCKEMRMSDEDFKKIHAQLADLCASEEKEAKTDQSKTRKLMAFFDELQGVGLDHAQRLLRLVFDKCPSQRDTSYHNPCINHQLLLSLLPLIVDALLHSEPSGPSGWHELDGRSGCLVWEIVLPSADLMKQLSAREIADTWNTTDARKARQKAAASGYRGS